jgi:hypothetical protein
MLLPLLQLSLPTSMGPTTAQRLVDLVCEGQVDAAFELFENAQREAESSKLAPAWAFAGACVHAQAGHINKAVRLIKDMLTVDGPDLDANLKAMAQLKLTELFTVSGQLDEARQTLQPAKVDSNWTFWSQYIQATWDLMEGRMSSAVQRLSSIETPRLPTTTSVDPLISVGIELLKCEVLLESGRVTEAQEGLARASALVNARKLAVFHPALSNLNQEITLLTTQYTPTTDRASEEFRTWSPLDIAQMRRVRGREFAIAMDRINAERILQDIEVGTPPTLLARLITADIRASFEPVVSGNTPRATCVASESSFVAQTEAMADASPIVSGSENIWTVLAQTVIAVRNANASSSPAERSQTEQLLNEAILVATQNGMTRYQVRLEALRASVEPHYQIEWLEKRGQLTRFVKYDAESFTRRITGRSPLGIQAPEESATVKIRSNTSDEPADLEINEPDGMILLGGERLPIVSGSVLFRILTHLALSRGQAVSKSQLVQAVWDKPYKSEDHDTLVYNAIRRLRMYLPIESSEAGYNMPETMTWDYIPSTNTERTVGHQKLSSRQTQIIDYIRTLPQTSAHRGQLVEGLGISPRTALRELTRLASTGMLERVGAGRSARYVLNTTADTEAAN